MFNFQWIDLEFTTLTALTKRSVITLAVIVITSWKVMRYIVDTSVREGGKEGSG